jgi:hypothetical protein
MKKLYSIIVAERKRVARCGKPVSKPRDGKHYASILFEFDEIIADKKVETAIGLDSSMKSLYVNSDGNYAAQKRLAKEQREARITGSKGSTLPSTRQDGKPAKRLP